MASGHNFCFIKISMFSCKICNMHSERTANNWMHFICFVSFWANFFSWLFYVNANDIGVLGFNSQMKFKENAYTTGLLFQGSKCVFDRLSFRVGTPSEWLNQIVHMYTGFTKLINNIWFTQTETSSNVGNHNFTIATTIWIDKIILLNLPITYLGRHLMS